MKGLPPPKPNDFDTIKRDLRDTSRHGRPLSDPPIGDFAPGTEGVNALPLDSATLQAIAMNEAANTRDLLRTAIRMAGREPDEGWLDAVLGVFEV